ncbi:LysR family transcriptional regulator [Sessilibacter corallicola]|uniref:LysR family transcriptional regulator n=1 Tax=Sessilibacter corallicola TaxID=2904075 RepID=A0ABQ0AB92_9GAMM
MDKLHAMHVFVAIAEVGSFAHAARNLALSPPAATRAISALEEQLGVKLFQRTTRHVRLTDAGQRYFTDCKRILGEIKSAEDAVNGIVGEAAGQLVVTAPILFGRKYVLPSILEYLNEHPKVEITTMFIDRVVNLMEEDIDVSVRIGVLPDSSLHSIKLGEVGIVTCASPEYLEHHGTPEQPEDLANHKLIQIRTLGNQDSWRYMVNQREVVVRNHSSLVVNQNQAAIDAAVASFGITRVLSYQIDEHVKNKSLVPILQDYALPKWPVNILHREGRNPSAKMRGFIDLLTKDVRENLS